MRFLRRSIVGLFLISVTVGLLALAGSTVFSALQSRMAQDGAPQPARERVFTAEVVTVEPGRVVPVLTAFGEIGSRRTLELRAPAEGTVIHLADSFQDGGAVEAGQVLVRIDPSDAQSARDVAAADLREANADLRDALRALELARADVEAAQAQAELRDRALARQEDLANRGVGSAAAVETAELAAATAGQAVLSRRQALAQAEARLDQAGTALERREIALADAERTLAQTELRAGFDGVLAEVDVVEGRLVNRNEMIGRLIDPDALEVAFRISTAQYARLLDASGELPRLPVTVILDVLGLDLTAEAVLTRESGSVGDGQSGRLLFADLSQTRGFRVGDFVTVRLEEPPLDQVASLPATALDSADQVLVLTAEDRLEEMPVTVLRRQGDDVIVRAPADLAGREVVTARTPVLGAGIRVTPIRPAATGAAEPEGAATITLDPDRRARLIAFVESSATIPPEMRDRMVRQLNEDEVPATMVARIEARMGS